MCHDACFLWRSYFKLGLAWSCAHYQLKFIMCPYGAHLLLWYHLKELSVHALRFACCEGVL